MGLTPVEEKSTAVHSWGGVGWAGCAVLQREEEQCLEPLIMSWLGWCLGNVALMDLAIEKLGWSCSGTFRRDRGIRAQ